MYARVIIPMLIPSMYEPVCKCMLSDITDRAIRELLYEVEDYIWNVNAYIWDEVEIMNSKLRKDRFNIYE